VSGEAHRSVDGLVESVLVLFCACWLMAEDVG
jgi:hypothetical protein